MTLLPEIGEVVLWHPDAEPSPKPFAAIVTAIGMDNVCVNILDPNTMNFRIKDGVHHIDDPKAQHPAIRENGAWEHTPATKRLHKLQKRLAEIDERLLFLEAVKESGERHATLLERLG